METQSLVQQLEGFERDMDWIQKHYDSLKEKYPNKHVAVLDEGVVDHDRDLRKLMDRIKLKYPEVQDRVAIDFVSPEKIELILPYPR
ncbi:MAG: hypothetical protein IID16_12525 [Candidatus Marinimicrobia bacterium]|nr:hypothetical protein [Candidatus Neomarinimicrobiota bacterium]